VYAPPTVTPFPAGLMIGVNGDGVDIGAIDVNWLLILLASV
jgi:hypothetical protein